ncbi:MAG TPA: sodium:proton antiporter [Candidatus Binatia bacterium]|nr:sodium:proton antiporter [Candidatus Binatia bacterium]
MILPFGVLLTAIALAPLAFRRAWEKYYPQIALCLGAITLGYYCFGLHAYGRVLQVTHEYFSFIVLIGSLFVVAGGIHLNLKGEASPLANTFYLFLGAVLANLLGTTGASMLLIRPWLRMNKYRITAHHIAFFIFIVSNVGGCLTPVGDPPLFLGYLKGIPFWWVGEHCWPMWAIGVGFLLAVFYVLDSVNYRRAPKPARAELTGAPEEWRVEGLWNLAYLAAILGAVFLNHPAFLREGLMLAAAAGSYFSTRKETHAANQFTFHPILEVMILFVGIFATMMPALDWLQAHAASLGRPTPGLFYWGSGCLSSMLDNAPTYLGFLSAAFGSCIDPAVIEHVQQLAQHHGTELAALTATQASQVQQTLAALQTYHSSEVAAGTLQTDQIEMAFLLGNAHFNLYLVAISVGAVFFGANTYIGNGPNFMVKAIADHQKVRTPGFLGLFFRYTLPCMGPLLLLLWLLFFRN